jgi:integrase/recombinase XerD
MALEHVTRVPVKGRKPAHNGPNRAVQGGVPSALETTIRGFLLACEAARLTPATLDSYRYALDHLAGFLAAQGVDTVEGMEPSHLRLFLVELERKGNKPATVHLHARVARRFLNWCTEEGLLDRSPMDKVAMPRRDKDLPEAYSEEEVAKLLKATTGKDIRSVRDRALVLLLLDSGLRASEALSLTVGDLDTATGEVLVTGKGSKQRTVRVGTKARLAVLAYLRLRKAGPDEPLCCGSKGPLTRRGLEQVLADLGERAGVAHCHPHRFRRSFALACLRAGMDVFNLQRLMGHSDLTTLQKYLPLVQADVVAAHERFGPVDNMLGNGRTNGHAR